MKKHIHKYKIEFLSNLLTQPIYHSCNAGYLNKGTWVQTCPYNDLPIHSTKDHETTHNFITTQ